MGLVPTLPVVRMEEGADLPDGAGAQVRRGAASGPQGQAHPACGLGPGQGCREGLGGHLCRHRVWLQVLGCPASRACGRSPSDPPPLSEPLFQKGETVKKMREEVSGPP